MGRSAREPAIPAPPSGLQAHQTDGTRTRRSGKRSRVTAVNQHAIYRAAESRGPRCIFNCRFPELLERERATEPVPRAVDAGGMKPQKSIPAGSKPPATTTASAQ